MPALQPVRGTHDLLPEEKRRHLRVEETARSLAARYGYAEMSTPVFEFTEVFQKSLGETSDIVTKEMYTFTDKGGDSITLRPEFTAGVARAILSNGLQQVLPVKVFCRGPMFRYERPQKGRLRQFHQVDVEIFGVADPLADVEVIALGAHLLEELGIGDKVALELNTLGDQESRRAYRSVLVGFLNDHRERLSEESLLRLERNPLRVFDSKDEGDRRVMAEAPLLADHLNDASRRFFDAVMEGLAAAGVGFAVNARLVRGLDYYCHTAFEFTTAALGAQGAVIAGGRYDGLMEQIGGAPVPGTGWAAGIERLALLADAPEPPPRPLAVIAVGEAQSRAALGLAQRLRRWGFTVELAFAGSLKKRMKQADRAHARVALIVGEDELERGVVTVRDMETGEQTAVPEPELESHLARRG
jgi:histidyl-tRNA synthetase